MGKRFYCSFCGKDDTQVATIVAGPDRAGICNECIDLCADIINPAKLGSREYDSWAYVLSGDNSQ